MVLAMTMVMGMSMTAMAGEPWPDSVTPCEHSEATGNLIYVYNQSGITIYTAVYDRDSGAHYFSTSEEYIEAEFPEGLRLNTLYHKCNGKYYICGSPVPPTPPAPDPVPSSPSHVHDWVEGEIYAATQHSDGLGGTYCKSCGAVKDTYPISAYGYTLNDYAGPMINAAKSGQTITFEFGEWNSFPKAFMEKIAAKSMEGVTFVFHYKWNHVKQEITIPFGTVVDTSLDWYGPAKMAELYGAN